MMTHLHRNHRLYVVAQTSVSRHFINLLTQSWLSSRAWFSLADCSASALSWQRNWHFSLPTLIWCPCSGWFCPNFQMNLNSRKTRMMALSDGEDLVILAGLI